MPEEQKIDYTEFKNCFIKSEQAKFGKYTECLIKILYGFSTTEGTKNDLFDENKKERIEVKFSRAKHRENVTITESNCYEEIMKENKNILIDSDNTGNWQCHFSQIKPDCFDRIFFGIVFNNHVEIFSAHRDELIKDPIYCETQHRGNTGEGQIHMSKTFINKFREKYLCKTLD